MELSAMVQRMSNPCVPPRPSPPLLAAGASALAVALTLTANPVLLAQISPGVSDEAVVIGMEAPTGSFSLDEENLGMRVLIDEVNAADGVHGRRIEVRSHPRSDGTRPDEAVANARRLMVEDEVFLLFNFGGPASVSIADLASEHGVPYLFPHTALVTRDDARFVFTSFPRYDDETRIVFRFLVAERGFGRLAIVHDANAYGVFFRDQLRDMAAELGYEFVGAVEIPRNPADATAALDTLRQSEPDAVVLALFPDQARRVMEAKARLEWGVTMVTSGPLTDEQYLEPGGTFAEGTLGFCHFADPSTSDVTGIERYRAAMARHRPGHPLNRYSLYGYTFGRLVVEGLQRAGRTLTRDGFIDAMETIEGWDLDGALPPVTFSPANHHAQRAGFVCELTGGRFRSVTGWVRP